MGAEISVPRDGKSQEDAPASASASGGELSAEGSALQERSSVTDSKPLAKNGQISSMTSLNGHSEDNTLAEGVNFYKANKLQSLLTMLIHQLAARRQNDFFPSEKGSDPRGKG
ncbi:Protein adenylyltransferase SelO [Dissostichus eleginoides]|uniref:Protein adenylyltransferase SelO n=1 Tax=Dissostichus eleginoides TaxID=100907 RepID=A0AAD9BV18_DISEL|nr:Protein adenylyltransferase SelO [Dissostichus eleginoides]